MRSRRDPAGTCRAGIDQYLADVQQPAAPTGASGPVPSSGAAPEAAAPKGAQIRQAKKDLQRLERDLEKLTAREQELHDAMAASATDHQQLAALTSELETLVTDREQAESDWRSKAASLLEVGRRAVAIACREAPRHRRDNTGARHPDPV